jgi:diaminopimelate epimerase
MKSKVFFWKMHGLGNDFLVFENATIDEAKAQRWCDRRFGIGADQILKLKKPDSKSADAVMEIWNADGSRAEMCGNGIRAVALYLKRGCENLAIEKGKSKYRIETGAGVLEVEILKSGQSSDFVRVDMGAPKIGAFGEKLEYSENETVFFYEVSMGNPHAVIETADLSGVFLEKVGPLIELNSRFPKKTNVEFFQVRAGNVLDARVWERGAGITLACGTGACATGVTGIKLGRVKSPTTVRLPGGDLKIEWSGKAGDSVFMSGPAEFVFRGEI